MGVKEKISLFSKVVSIDRCVLYGGAAKRTSIKGSIDFDFAVFINGGKGKRQGSPTIGYALDNFQDLLLMADAFDLKENDIRQTPTENPKTLQFAIQGVDFDLSVAYNFMQGSNRNVVHRQTVNVFRDQSPSTDHRTTSGQLVETNVEFAKQQSAFAHEVM